MSGDNKDEIDDSLYSRQRYVLGDSAMKKMAHSSIFLSGLGGLGVEIAKNVVLAGVKSLTIHDEKICQIQDLGCQFFLRDEDVANKKNRAEASVDRLAELNPYVSLKCETFDLNNSTDLSFLNEFQCVILTEVGHKLLEKINKYCRTQNPPIQFISADVRGVFSYTFCDFGPEFTIVDATGEAPKECFISTITKDNPGIVTSLDNIMHDFQSGDHVIFKEVKGMDIVNGLEYKIKVISPYSFSICDTTGEAYRPYLTGGIVTQVKVPITKQFESMQNQLKNPYILPTDFVKDHAMSHIGFCALYEFQEQHGMLPQRRSKDDEKKLLQFAEDFNNQLVSPLSSINKNILSQLSATCRGSFAPLCAAVGGIIGQEVIKAVTGKFSPLNQWLYLDAIEVLKGQDEMPLELFKPKGDRYDSLRACIGDDLCQKLANLKLFMVGCGAIGCEMMKNYALLGISTGAAGKIMITDYDLIEKSNLNRQFLFRRKHIQKPKSTTAAESSCEINPGLKIEAHQNKVHPATERIYNDEFFVDKDIIVNALDNLEARRYVDIRCVTNQKPLMESGTLGTKGHVQVIIPHMTESYGSQQDPPELSVPYCTLKSFPATIEHTIPWAREKFGALFSYKPSLFNKYWEVNGSPEQVLEQLRSLSAPENTLHVLKLMRIRPCKWAQCVSLSRNKFEKYYNHKAKQLLSSFPLDCKTADDSPFWQSPKRLPTPIEFNANCDLHMTFVESCSKLLADYCNIPYTDEDRERTNVRRLLKEVTVVQFIASDKKIITDETQKKPEVSPEDMYNDVDIENAIQDFKKLQEMGRLQGAFLKMSPVEFEKDDDSNGHIDFITSASNLRASMYSIENADRFKTKLIAGRIVPAIATTTAAVSGLVTIELIKFVKGCCCLQDYKNAFLNLALSTVMFTEPAAAEETKLKEGVTFTEWDRWAVHGTPSFTMKDFLKHFYDKYQMNVSLVFQGTKMVYVSLMPGHKKRLSQKMVKLIKVPDGVEYIDLTIAFEIEGVDEDGDIGAPPVRYYFNAGL